MAAHRDAEAPASTRRDDLLAETLDAYERGIGAVAPARADLDAYFNADYLLRMATSLTLPEVSLLLESSRLREDGLRLARKGELNEARRWLADASDVFGDATLSEEARDIGWSFQHAADAFLMYREGDAHAARDRLHRALELCRSLAEQYAYNVEVRRVHLARNIVRVDAVAGEHVTALHMALDLVRYTDGDTSAWPLQDTACREAPRLHGDEQRMLMDQVWGEISRLLTRDGDNDALWHDSRLVAFQLPPGSPFRALRSWLDAVGAWQVGDADGFLHEVQTFFRGGPLMENAWREVAEVFLTIARASSHS